MNVSKGMVLGTVEFVSLLPMNGLADTADSKHADEIKLMRCMMEVRKQ